MLKAGLGSSCQRSPVATRNAPKTTAATGSPLSNPPPPPASPASSSSCSSLSLRRTLRTPQLAPASPARSLPSPSTATAAVSTSIAASAAAAPNGYHSPNGTSKQHQHSNGHTNHNGNGHANGNGNGHANGSNGNGNGHQSHASAGDILDLQDDSDLALLRGGASSSVRVHVVVPRCITVPGQHMVLVGDCEALGRWELARGLPLHWCPGHMHSATFTMPAGSESIKAKLVLVHSGGGAEATWETGLDRSMVLQPPSSSSGSASSSSKGGGRSSKSGAATTAGGGGAAAHDYVVVCHWGHTEATSVLAREVPEEVLAMELRLSNALSELRTARSAAATSQEKLQRMAMDLATSERASRQNTEQLAELQAKHSALVIELAEAKRQAKAAAAEAAAAKAASASAVNAADVEARVSQRYEGRMAELKLQLEGVKSQYSSEVSSLQLQLDASLGKEAEAQEMVKSLREIVQRDVARLRTELGQLVNEYIAARQQLQEQAQQIDASEKLRMQQIDGLSSEIKNLIGKYNNAQNTIADQQRLLEELQATRGGPMPARGTDPSQSAHVPPAPDSQAGRGWRADWARLSKLSAGNGTPAAAHTANTTR